MYIPQFVFQSLILVYDYLKSSDPTLKFINRNNIKICIKNSVINKILSYGSEAWSLTKKEMSQLNVFERKISRRIFGPVFDNKVNEWRILNNEELDQKSKEPNIVETVKINRLRWL